MNIVKRSPVSFSRELDAFFENFLESSSSDMSHTDVTSWSPAVDLKEEEDRYLVFADIPGVKPEDIHVSVEDNLLKISGERSHESKTQKNGYTRVERDHGSFQRQFKLPEIANGADVVAKFNQGVLEVSIPKQELAKPQRIQVEVSSD